MMLLNEDFKPYLSERFSSDRQHHLLDPIESSTERQRRSLHD